MNEDYTSPEWEGLPSFTSHASGFCVRILDKRRNNPWLKGEYVWNTVMCSYGHSWTYKGFAINCAKGWVRAWGNNTHYSFYACVVDLSNEKVVWSSWRDG